MGREITTVSYERCEIGIYKKMVMDEYDEHEMVETLSSEGEEILECGMMEQTLILETIQAIYI